MATAPGSGWCATASPNATSVISRTVSPSAGETNRINGPRLLLADALVLTLLQNPKIMIQRGATKQYAGAALQAQGAFDLQLASSVERSRQQTPTYIPTQSGRTVVNAREDQTLSSLSFQQLLRSGVHITPNAAITDTDNHSDLSVPQALLNAGVTVNIPFRRGLGRDAVTASERAARSDWMAARAILLSAIADQVLAAINAYWTCLSAEDILTIMRESEERSRQFVELTRILIQGYLQPPVMAKQAQANLDKASANSIKAERNLYSARQTLAQAIGWDAASTSDLPLAASSFPALAAFTSPPPAQMSVLIQAALRDRPDLESARLSRQSAVYRLAGYRNALLPQLNLQLAGGYSGADDSSYFGAMSQNAEGPNFSANLAFGWPIQNRAARGQYLQGRGMLEQSIGAMAQIEIQIRTALKTDVAELERALAELRKRQDATGFYRQSVSNQQMMFSLGMATLLDLLNTENDLADAQSMELIAKQTVAQTIAQLHYDAGRLVSLDNGEVRIHNIYDPAVLTQQRQARDVTPIAATPRDGIPELDWDLTATEAAHSALEEAPP